MTHKSKALKKKSGKMSAADKESKHIYRKSGYSKGQGNWHKIMPGDR